MMTLLVRLIHNGTSWLNPYFGGTSQPVIRPFWGRVDHTAYADNVDVKYISDEDILAIKETWCDCSASLNAELNTNKSTRLWCGRLKGRTDKPLRHFHDNDFTSCWKEKLNRGYSLNGPSTSTSSDDEPTCTLSPHSRPISPPPPSPTPPPPSTLAHFPNPQVSFPSTSTANTASSSSPLIHRTPKSSGKRLKLADIGMSRLVHCAPRKKLLCFYLFGKDKVKKLEKLRAAHEKLKAKAKTTNGSGKKSLSADDFLKSFLSKLTVVFFHSQIQTLNKKQKGRRWSN
ncbi:hypothetical protein J437_LFUL014028 [Ladona fulva]|uniref:Uncharacterized protein n=1 Tax=Ladona fulva TaxID=123851 RepID=A0A8K0P9L8_LADFU|nr:hypothetical protein J437_LFUL014028 [Ladona fulva]